MNYSLILGTRPEIIKLSGIIRYLESQKDNFFIIHTNQHYSENLDTIFFRELGLTKPQYNLNIGSGNHGYQTGKMLTSIEQVLLKEKPDVVIVQGDTNTVFSGALAAAKLNIPVAHVEAGLRSNDRTMPEELNRIMTDHISTYLFPPTAKTNQILLREGIDSKRIKTTGNTIVDAVFQNLKLADSKSSILSKLNLNTNNYILLTAHRAENTDSKEKLANIIKGTHLLANDLNMEVIYPIHPRTLKMIEKFKITIPLNIKVIDPVGFLDFLLLQKNARIILTDSGGIQEESCILQVPCVTLRENTERPETIDVGGNILAGTDPSSILEKSKAMLNIKQDWNNPFGDGNSSKTIIDFISSNNG
jgi:UDP-N-acetylglucosamine 2-epimerase (non-hydrolysing)